MGTYLLLDGSGKVIDRLTVNSKTYNELKKAGYDLLPVGPGR